MRTTPDAAAKQKPPLALKLDGKRFYPSADRDPRADGFHKHNPFGLLLLVTQRLELLLALVLGDLLAPLFLQVTHDAPSLVLVRRIKCRSII